MEKVKIVLNGKSFEKEKDRSKAGLWADVP